MSQTNAQLLADSLGTASTGTIPIGGIILWSGSVESIPIGYVLCDGNNSTPDLRNRFVVGAGNFNSNQYPNLKPNATPGGSANAVLLSHTHTQSGGGTQDDGGSNVPGSTSGGTQSNISNAGIDNTGTLKTDGSVSGTNANLPPYYALAYIMRTS